MAAFVSLVDSSFELLVDLEIRMLDIPVAGPLDRTEESDVSIPALPNAPLSELLVTAAAGAFEVPASGIVDVVFC